MQNPTPYTVRMSGGDTFARFAFSADAEKYARQRSRAYPEVIFSIATDFGQGELLSCEKFFKAGRNTNNGK